MHMMGRERCLTNAMHMCRSTSKLTANVDALHRWDSGNFWGFQGNSPRPFMSTKTRRPARHALQHFVCMMRKVCSTMFSMLASSGRKALPHQVLGLMLYVSQVQPNELVYQLAAESLSALQWLTSSHIPTSCLPVLCYFL